MRANECERASKSEFILRACVRARVDLLAVHLVSVLECSSNLLAALVLERARERNSRKEEEGEGKRMMMMTMIVLVVSRFSRCMNSRSSCGFTFWSVAPSLARTRKWLAPVERAEVEAPLNWSSATREKPSHADGTAKESRPQAKPK